MNNPKEEKVIYKPAELEIIFVDQADIICTSGGASIMSLDDDGDI